LFTVLEIGYCCAAQASFEIMILLPLPPECYHTWYLFFLELFHYPKQKLYPLNNESPFPPPPGPGKLFHILNLPKLLALCIDNQKLS
jgi:hypothetical protein